MRRVVGRLKVRRRPWLDRAPWRRTLSERPPPSDDRNAIEPGGVAAQDLAAAVHVQRGEAGCGLAQESLTGVRPLFLLLSDKRKVCFG